MLNSDEGYCDDWKYLPEGGYPDTLPVSNPLFDADKVRECGNRCIHASRENNGNNDKAFYVRYDGRCGCSTGPCNS